jgi:hypothetical protein
MTDQRDFSQRTDPSGTSYPEQWIKEIDRIAQQRPEDGNAPRISVINDILQNGRFSQAVQPGPSEMLTPRDGQFDQPIGAQPRPDGSGVSLVTDPEPFPDGRKRDAREVQAANEGPTPSFYKNG